MHSKDRDITYTTQLVHYTCDMDEVSIVQKCGRLDTHTGRPMASHILINIVVDIIVSLSLSLAQALALALTLALSVLCKYTQSGDQRKEPIPVAASQWRWWIPERLSTLGYLQTSLSITEFSHRCLLGRTDMRIVPRLWWVPLQPDKTNGSTWGYMFMREHRVFCARLIQLFCSGVFVCRQFALVRQWYYLVVYIFIIYILFLHRRVFPFLQGTQQNAKYYHANEIIKCINKTLCTYGSIARTRQAVIMIWDAHRSRHPHTAAAPWILLHILFHFSILHLHYDDDDYLLYISEV